MKIFLPNSKTVSIKLAFLIAFLLYVFQPISSVSAAALFYDSFDTNTINTDKWDVVDTESKLDQLQGYLRLKGGKASAAYNDPAMYAKTSFSRQVGRAFVNILRSSVSGAEGPVMHFATSAFPTTPNQNGYGISIDSTGAEAPLSRFNIVIPGSKVSYSFNPPSNAYDPTTAKSIDYLTTTILRSTGSYHLVSGGTFGTFPNATLLWVNNEGSDATLTPGINNKNTQAWMMESKVLDLTGDFADDWGLATAADSFNRSGNINTTAVDLKGSATWNTVTGTFTANGSAVTSSSVSRSVVTATTEGIYEVTMTSPAAGSFQGGLIFRYSDANNYWYFLGWHDRYQIGYVNGGVNNLVSQSGALSFGNNQTKRMRVIVNGNNICPFVEESKALFNCFTNSFNSSANQVGIYSNTTAVMTYDDFAAWPKTVTLPTEISDFTTVPEPTSTVVVSDTFTDTNATNLTSHTMNQGSGWQTPIATWSIDNNKVSPGTAPAMAVTETGITDMAVSVDLDLQQAGAGTTEWFAGVLLRYEDADNYTWARFLWQSGSPEIEIWDVVNDVASTNIFTPPGFMNATNITDLVVQGDTKTMTFVAKGNQVAAYMDDQLIVQARTSRTTGTKAGLIINDNVTTPLTTFDNFTVKTVNADTVEPPAVTDLEVVESPTVNAPELSWTTIHDDASGTDYYRVYRSTTEDQLGTKINIDGDTTTGVFTDNSVTSNTTYYYTIHAVDEAGNESDTDDNLQVSVEYNGAPDPTPTPTPTPTATPSTNNSTQSSSSSSGNSSPPSSPICSQEKPSSAPDLFQISARNNSLKLYFTPSSGSVDRYFISYGVTENGEGFGTEIPGNTSGVQSTEILQLQRNTRYYLKIRAGNGCMPGDWSNILIVNTSQRFPTYRWSSLPGVVNTTVRQTINTLKQQRPTIQLQPPSEITIPSILPASTPTPTPFIVPEAAKPVISPQAAPQTASFTGFLKQFFSNIFR